MNHEGESPAGEAIQSSAGFLSERWPQLGILAAWGVSLIWLTPGILLPDAGGYISYLPSIWIGRDLLFYDEWMRLGMVSDGVILHKEITTTEFLGNHWTAGSSIFWLPAFLLGDLIREAIPMLRQFARDGFSLPYNVATITASAFAGLATLLIGTRAASLSSSRSIAALAALLVWFGSPLLWYSLKHSLMSHAVSALACALVVLASLRLRNEPGTRQGLLVGLALGFAFIVRPQNLTFALVPLILTPRFDWRVAQRTIPAMLLGGLIASLPQLSVSSFLYGNPFGFLTGGQRSNPFSALDRIWLWEPIFSWYHGMATWTPLLVLAVVGLVLLLRHDRRLAAAGLSVIASQWLINATLERSFWGGVAFGQRRLLNCSVFFIIGLAFLLSRNRRSLTVPLAIAATCWTMSLFFAADAIDLGRYYLPGELLEAQVAATRSIAESLRPLGSIPPEFRLPTALIASSTAAMLGLGFLILHRFVRTERRVIIASVSYLMIISAFITICGVISLDKRTRYATLIERNRAVALLPGGVEFREGLLRDEIRYLSKTGRTREARATERELEELTAMRREAVEKLRRVESDINREEDGDSR